MAKSSLTQYCCSAARREAESVAAKSSAAPAHTQVSGQEWLNRINGPHTKLRYIRCDEGVWEVTTPEFGEMLELYAKEHARAAHQALYEALSAAVESGAFEYHNECSVANCPSGQALIKARAALALADAAQEGEAKNGGS